MTEVIGSESSIHRSGLDGTDAFSWVQDTAQTALEHFKGIPVAATCETALAAGAVCAAISFKTTMLEKLTQLGAGKAQELGAVIAEDFGALIAEDLGAKTTRELAAQTTKGLAAQTTNELAAFVPKSPYIARSGLRFAETDLQPEFTSVAKPRLSFEGLPIMMPSRDKLVIPSFFVQGEDAATRFPGARLNIVPVDSEAARIYKGAKDSTVQVFRGKANAGGSGFFVDESGIIATANHVAADGRLPFRIQLASGESLPARLIGREQRADVAL